MYHQPDNQQGHPGHPGEYPINQPYNQAPVMPYSPGYQQPGMTYPPGYQQTGSPIPQKGYNNYQQAFPHQPVIMPPAPGFQPNADVYDPYTAGQDDFGLSKSLSSNSRLMFIRKVLGILSAQLALTAAGVTITVANKYDAIPFFNTHIYLLIVSLVVYIVSLYALGCYKSISRSVPTNYILLFMFTSAMTYMVSGVCALYEPEVVMAAAILTAATVGALAIYAITTKEDFTYCGGAIWSFFFIVMTGSMLCIFMGSDYRVRIILSCLIIFMCCFYIIYDIQLLVGGKAAEISMDDYIFAAMMIYIDIMRLFLEILKVLGKK